MKVKALLITQDQNTGIYLNRLFSTRFKDITVLLQQTTGIHLPNNIRQESPDIVFCEMDFTEASAYKQLDKIPIEKTRLIFLLNSKSPVINAFRLSSTNFLVKPFSCKDLKKVMANVLQNIKKKKTTSKLSIDDKIPLSTHNGYTLVNLSEIVYINSSGNYCTIVLADNSKITLTKLLGEFERTLPSANFVRSHQSYIINTKYITKVINGDGMQIILNSGQQIPVARRRKKNLFKALGI